MSRIRLILYRYLTLHLSVLHMFDTEHYSNIYPGKSKHESMTFGKDRLTMRPLNLCKPNIKCYITAAAHLHVH